MMKKYEKPLVMANDELAEGVFAASGAPKACFSVVCRFDGNVEYLGGENLYKYRVQIDATHNSDHVGTECIVQVTFAEAVTLFQAMDSSTSNLPLGAVSTTFEFDRAGLFYNPGPEGVGLGSIVVTSANPALAVPIAGIIFCNGAQ